MDIIFLEAQKNLDVLNAFLSFSLPFLLYFVVMLISLLWEKEKSFLLFMTHRKVLIWLLIIALLGSMHIAFLSYNLERTSLMGISTLIVIIIYISYLYLFNPYDLVFLPDRIQKLYLLMVILFILFGIIKMFITMVGHGTIILQYEMAKLYLEEAKTISGVRPEESMVAESHADKPMWPSPEEKQKVLMPVEPRGSARGFLLGMMDSLFVTPKIEGLIEAPAKNETIQLEMQIAAAARGAIDAPPLYKPDQLGIYMGDNKFVSRPMTLESDQGVPIKAIVVCSDSEFVTKIAQNQQDSIVIRKVLGVASHLLLPANPSCVCIHANLRQGLIETPIVGSFSEEIIMPDSPSDHDLQSNRSRGKNL